MLTYRCTNACRHCLYRCSPRQVDTWMSRELAQRVFDELAAEPHLGPVHIAGGEATLKMNLLEDVISLAVRAGVPLSYVETNGMWCTDRQTALAGFERLAAAGLTAVLVSASPYHNEFIPFVRTRTCVEAATEVFGPGGVIVWIPQMYNTVSQLPEDRTHTVAEFCRFVGLDERSEVLGQLYYLTPAGRVLEELRDCYAAHPAEHYRTDRCDADLMNTSHFHVDPFGNLFTGLCPGIAPGKIGDLHPEITPESHPVFWHLCSGGPHALMRWACERYDYRPRDEGYISKCDLCMDLRRYLRGTGDFAEIAPDAFYAELTEEIEVTK